MMSGRQQSSPIAANAAQLRMLITTCPGWCAVPALATHCLDCIDHIPLAGTIAWLHQDTMWLAGEMDPTIVISHVGPLDMAPHFYKIFDAKQDEVRVWSSLLLLER